MSRAKGCLSATCFLLLLLLFCEGGTPPGAFAGPLQITGTGGALGGVTLLIEEFRKTSRDVKIVTPPNIGSTGSIKAVLAGKLDIGLSARPLTEDERRKGARETPFARTAFVFAVNPRVQASDISLSEAVEIYAGRKTTWQDGTPIRLIARPPNDTDTLYLREFSPEMSAAVDRMLSKEGVRFAMTDQECADAMETLEGAFGTITKGLVVSEKRAIKVLSLSGIPPTNEAILDGSYPYTKTFSFVTGPETSPQAATFIAFAQSEVGGRILSGAGFVPAK